MDYLVYLLSPCSVLQLTGLGHVTIPYNYRELIIKPVRYSTRTKVSVVRLWKFASSENSTFENVCII